MARSARRYVCAGLTALMLAGGAAAQDLGTAVSPVLTVDSERIFASSEIGQRITKELEAKLEALAAENRQIEADLTAEELDLTEKRTAMKPDEFRLLADAFDEKVKRIRAEQDAKQRDLQARRDAEQQALVEKIAPILTGIVRERGAVMILERRGVVLSADSIDITNEAIARINAVLPEGVGPEVDAPKAPLPSEAPAPQ